MTLDTCLALLFLKRANLAVDLTPKDQVLDYLMGAFPVTAMDAVEDEDGGER